MTLFLGRPGEPRPTPCHGLGLLSSRYLRGGSGSCTADICGIRPTSPPSPISRDSRVRRKHCQRDVVRLSHRVGHWTPRRSEAVELGGYAPPRGDNRVHAAVGYHIRKAAMSTSPEADLSPSRWADGLTQRTHRYAYFPFGGGPRLCIRQQLRPHGSKPWSWQRLPVSIG